MTPQFLNRGIEVPLTEDCGETSGVCVCVCVLRGESGVGFSSWRV